MSIQKLIFDSQSPLLQAAVKRIAETVSHLGGRALIVGGSVRDALLGIPAKDFDVEVFGIEATQLEAELRKHFAIETVGRSFGVLLLKGMPVDVSIPRRERKYGLGHKGFLIDGDPAMSYAEAALRRDFRLNAISWDPLSGEIIDPVEGLADLRARRLRHVSSQFAEDPLRVLRAMQLAARFELAVDTETAFLCRTISPEGLPKERLFDEWSKLILKGRIPSLGLRFLVDCNWICYFPELEELIDCPQDPEWHPEGDVWTHTLHCLDAFARNRSGDDWEDLVVGLGVLCHDLGKPSTTFSDSEGRIRSPGHDLAGLEPTRTFLGRLTGHQKLIDSVLPLVETHMRPAELYKSDASASAIRRLARKVRIDRLLRVTHADMAGRPPLSADFPAGEWLQQRANELAVAESAPEPIVKGRHLIRLGLKPGRHFSEILKACFEAQLDSAFSNEEEGVDFAKNWLNKQHPS